MPPIVSIVIPVHNTLPYLYTTLDSCLSQTIGREHIEIIAVNDGSTDGSAEVMDEVAKHHPDVVTVIHQPASGGAAVPRNRGLEIASGRYVFFLDADDFLGPEALERLTAFADANDSDIVLGNIAGRNGREVITSMYGADESRVDLFSSWVYWQIEPWKLFRRSLLESLELRFPTGMAFGEDQPFAFKAYLHAATISVLSSYTCLYLVLRDDRSNLTCETRWNAAQRSDIYLNILATMTELVGTSVPAGPSRDHLLLRHWQYEGFNVLRSVAALGEDDLQSTYLAEMSDLMAHWYTDGIADHLHPDLQLTYRLILSKRFPEAIERFARRLIA